jgi:hypothetical protein
MIIIIIVVAAAVFEHSFIFPFAMWHTKWAERRGYQTRIADAHMKIVSGHHNDIEWETTTMTTSGIYIITRYMGCRRVCVCVCGYVDWAGCAQLSLHSKQHKKLSEWIGYESWVIFLPLSCAVYALQHSLSK